MVTSPLFWLRLPMLLIMSIRVGLSYSERAKERVWHSRNIFYGECCVIAAALPLSFLFPVAHYQCCPWSMTQLLLLVNTLLLTLL